MKKALIIFLAVAVLLLGVFAAGRYGWQLFGFRFCDGFTIESVQIRENSVRIVGRDAAMLVPMGFVGYQAEEKDGTLYVGVHFSGIWGFASPSRFDITIPTRGTVTRITGVAGNRSWDIYPAATALNPEPDSLENAVGINVILERQDIYRIGWHFENESGGVTNADQSPFASGKPIYLNPGIDKTAAALERPVPFMLTFSDREGRALAQVNLTFDPAQMPMTVTVTTDGFLVNGVAVAAAQTNAAYDTIIDSVRTALAEKWNGQKLADAGLCTMLRDVAPETVGYAVTDLNADGIPELAIGTLSGDDFYSKMILDLYTLDSQGNPLRVFQSTDRDRFYYAGGVRFANIGSSGADSSFETTLKFENGELIDMTFTTNPKDYVQMDLKPIV